MSLLDARTAGTMEGGASFSVTNRLIRVLWQVAWLALARWTPPPMHAWRRVVLRSFGAQIGEGVRVYGSARIWLPSNLRMEDLSWLGPRTNCYNQGYISIGRRVVISQGAHLCASSHDVNDEHFQLVLRPIRIEENAWVAAEAFVGPGVTIGSGAVLGARAVAVRALDPWTIYSGNPAQPLRSRAFRGATTSERSAPEAKEE